MENPIIFVRLATLNDIKYVNEIIAEMEASAIIRGSGIAKRSPDSISEQIKDGKAIIAVTSTGKWVGFSYREAWENQRFVSNSGLIVSPQFRNSGVASAIKNRVFSLSRKLYLNSLIFSIPSGMAILKMNTRLGFEPVTYDQITQDDAFWEGCKSCINYSILEGEKRCKCLYKAMLFDPEKTNSSSTSETQQLRIA